MRKTKHGGVVAVAVALLVIGWMTLGSRSASALSLVPPSLEMNAQPGETLTTSIKLYNETNDPTTLYTSTANFTAADQSGTPSFDFKSAPDGLASWISTNPKSLTLQPGERLTVAVKIAVPANADPGGHYAAVFFGTQPPSLKNTSGVAVASKVGTLVILTVAGQISETATVASWGPKTGKHSYTHPPIALEAVINNTGNVHIRPEGTVMIRNMFGGQTATIPFNSANGAILPNSSRQFEATWTKASGADPDTSFFHQVGVEWHNFAWGTYTATLSLTYGTGQAPLVGTTHFTVFPWQLLLVSLILVIVLVMVLVLGIRSYNAMIIRRVQNSRGPNGQA